MRIAVAQGNRAAIDLSDGQLDIAESGLAAAIDVLAKTRRYPSGSDRLALQPGQLEERRGKFDAAEAHFQRVLGAETQVLGAEH